MKIIKKIISGVTALALACGLSMSASAELYEGQSRAYRGVGYMAKYEVVSVDGYYTTVKITLKNTSKKKINHWAVALKKVPWKLHNFENCRIFNPHDVFSVYTSITDCGTNASLAPDECVSFCYTMEDRYGQAKLPERILAYSDLDKSNTVEELNKAAQECCEYADYILRYYPDPATAMDDAFREGVYEKSQKGMKTGYTYEYKARGDEVINIAASQYARGDISAYLGRTKINGVDCLFVQIRDDRTGKIGQYPNPTDGTAEWGKFTQN